MNKDAQVLIVDDEEQVLALLSSVITKNNLSVITASNGKQALSALRISDSIKLVLLDICLPDYKGHSLLEEILKISPSINVIMITGGTDIETAQKCLSIGAKDYIKKPFDIEYLETSVLADIIPDL